MNSEVLTPVRPRERIKEIDIIRGFALLGILMVNMFFFKYPLFEANRYPLEFPAGLEQAAAWLIQLLFTGKFYAIFSFLFGLGFFIFMERTLDKGIALRPLYRRRLAVLLAFGLLHLVLLWSGDILHAYAVTGFILLAFRGVQPATIKKWIITFFGIALVFNGTLFLLEGAVAFFAGEMYSQSMHTLISKAFYFYREGSFLPLTGFRLATEISSILTVGLVGTIPAVLGFFLCGLYAGKTGIFKDIEGNLLLIKKIWKYGLLGGMMFSLLFVLVETGVIPVPAFAGYALKYILNYLGSIFLFPFYIASLLLLLRKKIAAKMLAPLAAAGRMALTNYLSQTIICVLLFNSYGLGLFGTVSLSRGILITLAIYLVQIVWSNLWLRAFDYGPMEWLWRVLTYKKLQPWKAAGVSGAK